MSGSRGEAMNTPSSNVPLTISITISIVEKVLEAQLRSDNLRRSGEHVLYVKGIDDYGNVGETISTRWIVGT